jgi:hypothetical protein
LQNQTPLINENNNLNKNSNIVIDDNSLNVTPDKFDNQKKIPIAVITPGNSKTPKER